MTQQGPDYPRLCAAVKEAWENSGSRSNARYEKWGNRTGSDRPLEQKFWTFLPGRLSAWQKHLTCLCKRHRTPESMPMRLAGSCLPMPKRTCDLMRALRSTDNFRHKETVNFKACLTQTVSLREPDVHHSSSQPPLNCFWQRSDGHYYSGPEHGHALSGSWSYENFSQGVPSTTQEISLSGIPSDSFCCALRVLACLGTSACAVPEETFFSAFVIGPLGEYCGLFSFRLRLRTHSCKLERFCLWQRKLNLFALNRVLVCGVLFNFGNASFPSAWRISEVKNNAREPVSGQGEFTICGNVLEDHGIYIILWGVAFYSFVLEVQH